MALTDLLSKLPDRHRRALEWFAAHAGQEVPFTGELEDGTFLFSKPKGIYKPGDSQYALSVKQTLKGQYPDRDPIVHPDGTWTYLYHQEGDDPGAVEDHFTNRGLLACKRDGIPVGVARQTSGKPAVMYRILGLALVADWNKGFFRLEGVLPDGRHNTTPLDGPATPLLQAAEKQAEASGVFDPQSVEDARDRAMAAVTRRRGQGKFRAMLLRLYGGRCAITGCDAEAALEAAHITPYRGKDTHSPQNGILLRADLHALWDLGLVAVREADWTVRLANALRGTAYESYHGQALYLPAQDDHRPSPLALKQHWDWAGLD